MEQHADDLAALLDHLGIAKAVIAGFSMGGYVAFPFWRRHPERVAGLAFVDTRAAPDTPEGRGAHGHRRSGFASAGLTSWPMS